MTKVRENRRDTGESQSKQRKALERDMRAPSEEKGEEGGGEE